MAKEPSWWDPPRAMSILKDALKLEGVVVSIPNPCETVIRDLIRNVPDIIVRIECPSLNVKGVASMASPERAANTAPLTGPELNSWKSMLQSKGCEICFPGIREALLLSIIEDLPDPIVSFEQSPMLVQEFSQRGSIPDGEMQLAAVEAGSKNTDTNPVLGAHTASLRPDQNGPAPKPGSGFYR